MAAHERRLYYTGKPVFLHLNGDSYKRTRFVVRKEMKSFDSFLNAASLSLRTPAREIRTPGGRHRIQNLDDLERDGKYIVLGRERQFKKIEYEGKTFRPHQQVKLPEINYLQLNHRKFSNIPGRARVSGQRKKEEIKTIIAFCNGMNAKPKRVQLRTDFKMDQVLESVNDKVSSISKNGAVYYLYTLDGHCVAEPSELDDYGQYVAVGREKYFDRSVNYNDQGVASQLTPRRTSNKPKVTEIKPPRKARRGTKRTTKKKADVEDLNKKILEDFSSRDGNGHSSPESPRESEPVLQFENTLGSLRGNDFFSEHVEEPLRSYASEARKDSLQEEDVEEIPLNEQIKEKVADVLGDNGVPLDEIVSERQDSSVDGGRSSQGRVSRDEQQEIHEGGRSSQGRASREEQQEVHEVKPSVYEASGEDRINAGEIQDDRETIEDKPIDQMPAEEVADEEIEENNENQEDAEEDADNRHPEEVPNEEIMEENSEAKERDNGLIPPEENEPSEGTVEANEQNGASEENQPSEENEPVGENTPSETKL